MGEIGTDENFGDKTGGDRPREHCIFHVKPHLFKTLYRGQLITNFINIFAHHKRKLCCYNTRITFDDLNTVLKS